MSTRRHSPRKVIGFPTWIVIVLAWTGLSAPAGAQEQAIDGIAIRIVELQDAGQTDGWLFEVDVEGSDLGAISFTPPDGSPIALSGDSDSQRYEARFSTLAALRFTFTDGTYSFALGADSAALEFVALDIPDSDIVIGFPRHQSLVPNSQPTLIARHECTNCSSIEMSFETAGQPLFGLQILDSAAFKCSFPFSEFTPPASGLTELPGATQLVAEAQLQLAAESDETTVGEEPFRYTQASQVRDQSPFEVVTPSDANRSVDEVSLRYNLVHEVGEMLGWEFDARVFGSELSAIEIHPPCANSLALIDEGEGEFENVVGGFPDLLDLQQSFPPTNEVTRYVLVIDDGAMLASVELAPEIPDGIQLFEAPEVGEVVGATPTFEFFSTCANCEFMSIVVEDLGSEPLAVDVAYATVADPDLPTSVAFEAFAENQGTAGPIDALPDGDYLADATAGNGTVIEDAPLLPDGNFVYEGGAFVLDFTEFTVVPEPGSGGLAWAALLTLAGRVRRARRVYRG